MTEKMFDHLGNFPRFVAADSGLTRWLLWQTVERFRSNARESRDTVVFIDFASPAILSAGEMLI